MTIQSIGNINQTQTSMRSDFRNLAQSMKAVQDAENSGNQDQVTLSRNALVQAAAQVQNDISGATKGQSAGNVSHVQAYGNGRIQNIQNDLQALQTALNSTSQSQGASQNTIDNAMSKVASDVSALHKGHHGFHHGHGNMMNSANPGNNTNYNDTISSLAALFGSGTASQSQSSTSTLNVTA